LSKARASRSEAPLVAILRGLKPSEAEAVFGGLIGAGTVLTVEDVDSFDAAGGRLMVSPNVEPEVIRAARAKNMITLPGVFTATEALAALKFGATGLECFPAGVFGPLAIPAIRVPH
jgi:2-dehydro-3-deoxyphosphogalactonate aldolase